MNRQPIVLTGFGSVSVFGPRRGVIASEPGELSAITRWPTRAPRRARQVPVFRAAEVVPGLKTRRLDRLSTWALVATDLALHDAGISIGSIDGERAAITFGTVFGCLDSTEEFMASIARNGHARADPILFPETLSNLPASHVARHFGVRGPNVTLGCGELSGEAALAEAVAELDTGEADFAIVMAGDVLSRALFEWYEESFQLAAECREFSGSHAGFGGFVPGEGLGAVVVETAENAARRGVRPYAELCDIDMSPGPDAHPLFNTSAYTGEFWSTGILGLALTLSRVSDSDRGRFVVALGSARGTATSVITLGIGDGGRR